MVVKGYGFIDMLIPFIPSIIQGITGSTQPQVPPPPPPPPAKDYTPYYIAGGVAVLGIGTAIAFFGGSKR